MKRKTIATVLIIASLVILSTGCTTFDNFKDAFLTDKGVGGDTVKIGVYEPQTGSDSSQGELEIQGIELAQKLAPKVLGKKIELVSVDTQSDVYVAETAIQDLIDKEPTVILGSYGEATSLIAASYVEKAKVPAITISAVNPLITSSNGYYFRICFLESFQGKAIARYAYEGLKQKSAVIVRVENDDTASPVIRRFSKELTSLTGDSNCITAEIGIPVDETKYKKYALALQKSECKVVFMPVPLDTADKIFAELDTLGVKDMTIIGTNSWHTDELLKVQERHKELKIAVAADVNSTTEESTLYTDFMKLYKEEYGDDKPAESTVQAFDAYMLAVDAIERANSIDGYKIKQALAETKNFEGASGTISFDENGNPIKDVNIDVIRKGDYVTVYPKDKGEEVQQYKTTKKNQNKTNE